jgi:hypothetical protein
VGTSRRLAILVFSILAILFVGLLFWPFILNDIITPVSQVAWVLLRIFVLSIPQQYYWIAIVAIAAFLLYRRLALPLDSTVQSQDSGESNATMRNLSHWRSLFTLVDRQLREDEPLKRNLRRLLVALYATKQHTSADFRLDEALQQGKIPIPEQIHAVLFPEEPQQAGYSFNKLVQFVRNAPRKWIRHWTGQETAEDYRMLDEILCFMETSLEIKHDDGTFKPHQH